MILWHLSKNTPTPYRNSVILTIQSTENPRKKISSTLPKLCEMESLPLQNLSNHKEAVKHIIDIKV